MTADPVLRGDTYYLRRRVPKRFKPIEDRALIWVSLHTDSRREARIRADSVWAKMIEAWEGLCCTKRLMAGVPLSPDGLIPQLP